MYSVCMYNQECSFHVSMFYHCTLHVFVIIILTESRKTVFLVFLLGSFVFGSKTMTVSQSLVFSLCVCIHVGFVWMFLMWMKVTFQCWCLGSYYIIQNSHIEISIQCTCTYFWIFFFVIDIGFFCAHLCILNMLFSFHFSLNALLDIYFTNIC